MGKIIQYQIPTWTLRETSASLQWRHNGHDGVSNHQPHDCLRNRLFRRRSKKTSKLRVTGLCAWNSPVTGEFPAQMASNAENVSIWWRHHGNSCTSALVLLNTIPVDIVLLCFVAVIGACFRTIVPRASLNSMGYWITGIQNGKGNKSRWQLCPHRWHRSL